MRKCARCQFPLRVVDNGAVEVDHCDMCHGTFFDAHDIAKTWGKTAETSYWHERGIVDGQRGTRLLCPRDQEPMQEYRLKWDSSPRVVVDICPVCSGLWLDEGEGTPLRTVLDDHETELTAAQKSSVRGYLVHAVVGLKMPLLPVEVFNPIRHRPLALYGLIFSIVAVFLWQLWVVHFFGDAGKELARQFKFIPGRFTEGEQMWGLVTRGWMHSGWPHLIGNLYSLWIFGDNIEDRVGPRRFLLFYVAALFVSGFAYWLTHLHSEVAMLGASGAISGVMGAYVVLFPRVKLWLSLLLLRFRVPAAGYFGVWIACNVWLASEGATGVAFASHIGGFAAGLAFGGLWRRSLVRRAAKP